MDRPASLSGMTITSPGDFMVCPPGVMPAAAVATGWAQELYRRAYEQARAALAPSWFERLTGPSWN
jgi:hypothetical protein